ncbi:hypothetical protein AB395_0000836 [Sinorhizobium fredii CCBAU 45436]|nr:hypothetical protein SF83666_c08030 [Sinorhizobium fredii CCBAU 83666]AWI56513.1 hypothetical protein AB395_0000836 [Sinorhizobium fredii CCBAU 45436]AWM24307.1 hypothetical protein AOX55_00001031 [Sinorhizobium fredii CCBAU 25509]
MTGKRECNAHQECPSLDLDGQFSGPSPSALLVSGRNAGATASTSYPTRVFLSIHIPERRVKRGASPVAGFCP